MRREMYAMRRADGDWFSIEAGGRTRVPVFRSQAGAWRARARNPELMVFRPAPLDGRALDELATADGGRPVGFWLVNEEEPACDLRRGHPLEYVQLATLEGVAELPRRQGAAPRGQGGLNRATAAA